MANNFLSVSVCVWVELAKETDFFGKIEICTQIFYF